MIEESRNEELEAENAQLKSELEQVHMIRFTSNLLLHCQYILCTLEDVKYIYSGLGFAHTSNLFFFRQKSGLIHWRKNA